VIWIFFWVFLVLLNGLFILSDVDRDWIGLNLLAFGGAAILLGAALQEKFGDSDEN
jgi:hypothetical protein